MRKQECSPGLQTVTGNAASVPAPRWERSGRSGSHARRPPTAHAAWPLRHSHPRPPGDSQSHGAVTQASRALTLYTTPPPLLTPSLAFPADLVTRAPGQEAASTSCDRHTGQPPASPPSTQPRSLAGGLAPAGAQKVEVAGAWGVSGRGPAWRRQCFYRRF